MKKLIKYDKLKYILLTILFLPSILLSGEAYIRKAKTDIKNTYNVNVLYNYDRNSYFPPAWLQAPVSAKGIQVTKSETQRLLYVSEKFLNAYPKKVIQNNLENIYLLKDLKFYGKSYGATNSKTSLYLKSQGRDNGFTNKYLLRVAHAEFSSILLRNYKLDKHAWNNINQKSFKYIGTGRAMLGQRNLYGQSEKLLEDGFLIRYAQSSLENDFNQIASWLFAKKERLDKLCKKYPKINEKTKLVKSFYKSIDKDFQWH